jgi:uncharacterized protein YwqG
MEDPPEITYLPPQLKSFAGKIADSKLSHVDVMPIIGPTTRWNSKLRGVPYYPKDMPWPVDVDARPLVMLVQINFSEMPGLDGYPTEGILQIYISAGYLPEKQMWGMRNDNEYNTDQECRTDQSYFRMIYFPRALHDAEGLITATPAVEFDDDYGFPALDEALLTFAEGSSYVRPEDYRFRRFFGQDGFDFFHGRDRDMSHVRDAYEKFMGGRRYVARIGGYSRVEQQDPRLEFPEEDWIVLFSLDSEGDGDYVVGWGGGGIGNFYIRPQDLARRDFSKVMYYWDFG